MPLVIPNGRKEIEAMFGNPANADGSLNHAWEDQNIVKMVPPAGWQLYYQGDKVVPVSGIRLHRKLHDSFHAVLTDIWDRAAEEVRKQAGSAPSDEAIRKYLHERRLDLHGGGFTYRPITGGKGLSLHAYGIAIDWDPIHNPRQKPLKYALPDWWYDCWAKHGWHDGRNFPTPDPMHVQFATGA